MRHTGAGCAVSRAVWRPNLAAFVINVIFFTTSSLLPAPLASAVSGGSSTVLVSDLTLDERPATAFSEEAVNSAIPVPRAAELRLCSDPCSLECLGVNRSTLR